MGAFVHWDRPFKYTIKRKGGHIGNSNPSTTSRHKYKTLWFINHLLFLYNGEAMGEENQQTPLLTGSSILRTGTLWTAIAHIITAVIGSGVLSLAWAVAQLGWIAGPVSLLMFAGVTIVSSWLLTDCYRSPDPENGETRNRSYMEAVTLNLGRKSELACAWLQQESLFGCGITYVITASKSMRLAKANYWVLRTNILGPRYQNHIPQTMAVDESLEPTNGSQSEEDDNHIRTGNFWTCFAHIITAVIGSGVLSLAWSTAQLGWIAAPVSMLCFAIVTFVSASLLADCYRSPVTGKRNSSYIDAVTVNLGSKRSWVCGLLQYLSMYGTGIAYVITTSTCMRAIQKADCYHREGHDAPCAYSTTFYMLLFGASQIVFSQIPNFHDMEWLSIVAAIMSFSYSGIGFALGVAKVIENGWIKGSITGVTTTTTAQKVWKVSQALGDIAFAYPYSIILLEIQDTLKSPPPENKTMKKASMTAIFVTTFFYLCCGCFGYAAFGDDTPGNLLTGFGFYEPYWLIDFANVCIVVHLVGGYQVYSQPVFAFVEGWLTGKYPNNRIVNKSYTIKIPYLPVFSLNLLRLCFRTLYVISTTGIAMVFPYFNQVLGVLGAMNFWPLAIYFPVEMYFVQKKIVPWTKNWVILQGFSLVCLLVTVIALIGSVEGLISAKLS